MVMVTPSQSFPGFKSLRDLLRVSETRPPKGRPPRPQVLAKRHVEKAFARHICAIRSWLVSAWFFDGDTHCAWRSDRMF
jgi:hypothetical protein